jgi:hypothetical protein
MPTLPSGRILALSKNHILPPGVVTFKCPQGHYWFQQLDRKICPPPLKPNEEFLCDFVHAPCPTTRQEALAILQVLERIGPEPSDYHWNGYTLADHEALADLSPDDRAAWDAWVAEPKVASFLDEVIAQCKAQAEANEGNAGHMVFRGQPPRAPSDG